ncbi:PBSX family phage terminase large subunit [Virgibacillus dakarensis]|nr:PBSX family phage terminase large subunit [Virgibacillus dakarensis]
MKNKPIPYNTINIRVKKSVFNDPFYPILKDTNRFIVLYGGAGSGKSIFATQKLVLDAMKNVEKILVVRAVARTLRHSVFTEICNRLREWNMDQFAKINKSDMTIELANGSLFIFNGLDDVEKLKSISGITKIWIEEANQTKQEDLQQLNIRLRGKTKKGVHKQIIITFNPVSDQHWLKKYFFDNPKKNTTVLHTTYLDNKFIDEEYHEQMQELKNIDENYYKIYALGHWGSLGNMVYTNYVVEEVPKNEDFYDFIFNGLDFGWNDPNAVVRIGFKDQEIYIISELYKNQITNKELIEMVDRDFPIKKNKEWIVADSANPDKIMEFRRAGYKIKAATKGKDSIRFGIDYIRRMKIHIDESCMNFYKEITTYQYMQDKDGNYLDEPVDAFNHLMDAMRYALYDYLLQIQKLPKRRTANRSQIKRKGW